MENYKNIIKSFLLSKEISEKIYSFTDETAEFGLDDSEITIYYISFSNLKSNNVTVDSHKLEFPKKYAIQSLYKMLHELTYNNFKN